MKRLAMLGLALLAYGCATTPPPVPEVHPGFLEGYLGKDLPDSRALLPPPPVANGAAFANDQAVHGAAQALRGTPRYALASSDADLTFPHAASVFACAIDVPISQAGTPFLYQLLRRTLTDAGTATSGAKHEYNRTRPFVHYNEGTCRPEDEHHLRKDGSYPSGHTAIGWAWALVLTEIAPDRKDALLARGRSYGESRMVCNAHWQSDVLEGRAVGAGTVAQLHSNAAFRSDLRAARREVDAMRAKAARPTGDCAGEAAALAIRIPGVL